MFGFAYKQKCLGAGQGDLINHSDVVNDTKGYRDLLCHFDLVYDPKGHSNL